MPRPETIEALQSLILEAGASERSLEIRGGGSKAGIGRPQPADQLVDMGAFAGVVDYDPAELVLTAGAATPLAEIEALLTQKGQMLAFEPMDYGPLLSGGPSRATLGGVLAANQSGPRRLIAGAARDHFLGFEAVSGRGEAFKGGGKVVKNVTGYDLPKLLAGSWGTLAALTQVTVKVLPRPRSSISLVFKGLSDRDACAAMSRAVGSPSPVAAAAHLPAGLADACPGLAAEDDAATILRLEGVEPAIAAGVDRLRALLGDAKRLETGESAALWRCLRDVEPFCPGERPVWRVSLPPADGWRLADALEDLEARWFYDWAGGLIWLSVPSVPDAHAPRVREAAVRLGGHATLIRAPEATRAEVPVFQPEPTALTALTARMRAAFDPNGVLAPRHRLGG